jgi:hypothetical protein
MTGTTSISREQLSTINHFVAMNERVNPDNPVISVVIHPPDTLQGPARIQLHRAHMDSLSLLVSRNGQVS